VIRIEVFLGNYFFHYLLLDNKKRPSRSFYSFRLLKQNVSFVARPLEYSPKLDCPQ
jgi:hypothetical protein